jgi:hypothetical protein
MDGNGTTTNLDCLPTTARVYRGPGDLFRLAEAARQTMTRRKAGCRQDVRMSSLYCQCYKAGCRHSKWLRHPTTADPAPKIMQRIGLIINPLLRQGSWGHDGSLAIQSNGTVRTIPRFFLQTNLNTSFCCQTVHDHDPQDRPPTTLD